MTGQVTARRLTDHLPEYAAEAFGLGLFMLSACGFAVLLFHPDSPILARIPGLMARNALMGLAMGAIMLLNVYGPWGRRSGAHLNPVLTLTFFRLGKIARADLPGYIGAQFAGGLLGTGLGRVLFGPRVADPSVNYVATLPGPRGPLVAFIAEVVITFVLMQVVLQVSSRPRLMHYTGACAALLVAVYIAVESPLSGMSMNPARTVGSAAFAHVWTGWWIYFVAPFLGMLSSAELFRILPRAEAALCAKLYHAPGVRCIFCEHHAGTAA